MKWTLGAMDKSSYHPMKLVDCEYEIGDFQVEMQEMIQANDVLHEPSLDSTTCPSPFCTGAATHGGTWYLTNTIYIYIYFLDHISVDICMHVWPVRV